jgi:glucokinase
LEARSLDFVTAFLLGDIGGTNSRFGLAGPGGRPEQIEIFQNDTMPDLETAIGRYLQQVGVRAERAVLAVAGPVRGEDEVRLTNRAWRFRQSDLARRFGFSSLKIVNDFEAIAWSLLRLDALDVHALGPSLPERDGVKVALGPGTGLGVAALVPVSGGWHVLATEGGHASFGPQTPAEVDVFMRLVRTHGRVSAETVISGPGLVRLMRAYDPQTAYDAPEQIVAGAHAGEASAAAVITLFVRLFGRFAGGLALTFKSLGGVYIAGGVASRLGALLDAQEFRAAFENHAPYEWLMKEIPTWLMTRSEPGLLGCAVLADELARGKA